MRLSALTALLVLSAATGLAATTFRRITDRGPWGDYEAFPDVCRAPNGDLFVVFYAGRGHVTQPSDTAPQGGAVYGLRSTDEGHTWSESFPVVDTPEDDRDPHVCQLGNGDLLVTFFTLRYRKKGELTVEEGHVYVVRSSDGGHTWDQEPTRVGPTPYEDVEGFPSVFESGPPMQLKGGHLIVPVYGTVTVKPRHYETAMMHSTDFGRTWTDAARVDPEQSAGFSYGFCEASLTRLADGRLITVMRPGMHQSYSSDEGHTWTKAARLPHPGDAPTVIRTTEDLLIVGHRTPGTAVTLSADGGRTWGAPCRIDSVGGAYPGLVELEDGSILCIYYEEGAGSSVRAAVFRVELAARLQDLQARWPTPPPPGRKLDLRALNAAGKLRISTDMIRTGDNLPGAGPEAVFDGDLEHYHSAWKAIEDEAATYTLELDRICELTGLGICLKQSQGTADYPESAEVCLSIDGVEWGQPVAVYENEVTRTIIYKHFPTALHAKFVRVVVTKSAGWPGLNELELFAR